MRFDSGFWSSKTVALLEDFGVGFTMTVRSKVSTVQAAISRIPEEAWTPIGYPAGGVADVADCPFAFGSAPRVTCRLVIRRTRLVGAAAALFPTWRYHAFVTDLPGCAVDVDVLHCDHAVVELGIRDVKAEGFAHLPSGVFTANAVWAFAAAFAHNTTRWLGVLAGPGIDVAVEDRWDHEDPYGLDGDRVVVTRPGGRLPPTAATIRYLLVAVPGRLVNHSRRLRLRLPAGWPWADLFHRVDDRLDTLARQFTC